MAVSRKLIKVLRQELSSRANPGRAVRMQAYVKSAMPLYGINAPIQREIARAVFQLYPLKNFDHWHDTVLALWRGARFREERTCAIELCEVRKYKAFQTLDTLPLYEEMIVTGAWWDLVDPVATHRIRYLLTEYPARMVPVLKQWARCENIWKRRTAILSQLRRKGKTDLDLLYKCIEPSLGSSEFFLQKAIGWALRDYAWHDIREVDHYVNANKHLLSSLSQREALRNRNKLNKSTK